MDYQWLLLLLFLSLPIILIKQLLSIVTLVDAILALYYRSCGLLPCTIALGDEWGTKIHFWTSTNRQNNKPVLVLIHGYGSNPLWQFELQVSALSRYFNLYIPDLIFFGKSYTRSSDRTEDFQARSVVKALKKLGVEKCSVYSISYGGWVGYRMAEIYPKMVEKLVIVSSGVAMTSEQKEVELIKLGRDRVMGMLCPEKPDDLRLLGKVTMHRYGRFVKWLPDFFLKDYINVMSKSYNQERREIVEYILAPRADSKLSVLTQETLLIWGDQDKVFPLYSAHQLHRHLGAKSRLEIVKETGHAANMEAAKSLNHFITSFVLGS